jgi:hypothetical protein
MIAQSRASTRLGDFFLRDLNCGIRRRPPSPSPTALLTQSSLRRLSDTFPNLLSRLLPPARGCLREKQSGMCYLEELHARNEVTEVLWSVYEGHGTAGPNDCRHGLDKLTQARGVYLGEGLEVEDDRSLAAFD